MKSNKLMAVLCWIAFASLVFFFGYKLGQTESKAIEVETEVVEQVETEKVELIIEDAPADVEEVAQEVKQEEVQEEEKDAQRFESLGIFETTAYCACIKCCGKSDGITASGVKATAGRTVAADTSYLPFGTKVYINGHEYTVEDRGSGIIKKKIDIFFDSHQEALQYGRKQVEVFVSW